MSDSYDAIQKLMLFKEAVLTLNPELVKAAEKSTNHAPEMTEAENSRREMIIVAEIENNIVVE
jgi:hypothetical protein